ncbi:hypothetical protein PITC_001280 [Penicillium italicum]|uniref:Uncharacterized protein n=1 Tax=Penicillium italicum TaxID=40296 RepID=A0A0A2LFA7_PENIT|nr:hypothetical protein PITC_001280 [Penicillium italicum]
MSGERDNRGEEDNLIDPNSILALGRPTLTPLGILGISSPFQAPHCWKYARQHGAVEFLTRHFMQCGEK